MRRFVIVGQRAVASPDFLLADIPGTSGRLDVLLRCLRAALLVSHGLRRDTVVYLVLLGGASAPRSVRVDGAAARYVRPDERSLATTLMKALAAPRPDVSERDRQRFIEVRPGIAVADGGLEAVIADVGPGTPFILEEGAPDVRDAALDLADGVFFIGDHLGFDEATRARIASLDARPVGLGPVSVHAEDAVAILSNEIDRRSAP